MLAPTDCNVKSIICFRINLYQPCVFSIFYRNHYFTTTKYTYKNITIHLRISSPANIYLKNLHSMNN